MENDDVFDVFDTPLTLKHSSDDVIFNTNDDDVIFNNNEDDANNPDNKHN